METGKEILLQKPWFDKFEDQRKCSSRLFSSMFPHLYKYDQEWKITIGLEICENSYCAQCNRKVIGQGASCIFRSSLIRPAGYVPRLMVHKIWQEDWMATLLLLLYLLPGNFGKS